MFTIFTTLTANCHIDNIIIATTLLLNDNTIITAMKHTKGENSLFLFNIVIINYSIIL